MGEKKNEGRKERAKKSPSKNFLKKEGSLKKKECGMRAKAKIR